MIDAPEIRLQSMSVKVDGRTLLRPMDLQLPARTWCGIVGPNGGGKSTLVKAIAGLLDHEGTISLHWPQNRPGRIGYMPQRAEIDVSMPVTVQDYLRMHCQARPVWRRAETDEGTDALIKRLEVRPFLHQRLGSLSMGQHQRVMLCAALSNAPQLLILDEPMAGVDEPGREILLRVLADYHEEGGSVLVVEHNWEVIRDHCTTVLWIDQGLVDQGSPATILRRLSDRVSPFELPAVARSVQGDNEPSTAAEREAD
ncbi:MAG: metal ABC transporter ATP-binding protein [Pseudomonadota bacterium]